MTKARSRGEQIRRFIVSHVEKHPTDIAKLAAAHFGITRQAVNKHLQQLVEERALVSDGKTRNRAYRLCPLLGWRKEYKLNDSLAEDIVWRSDVEPSLGQLPENVRDIWRYGFTGDVQQRDGPRRGKQRRSFAKQERSRHRACDRRQRNRHFQEDPSGARFGG